MTGRWMKLRKKLERGGIFSTPRNDMLVLQYILAKFNGGYARLMFRTAIFSDNTACKKVGILKKIDSHFKKDFDKITEDEVIEYRDLLNKGEILCEQVIVKWDGKDKSSSKYSIVRTTKPLSYKTMKTYHVNFCEFWQFVKEHYYQENKQAIKNGRLDSLQNITKFWRVKQPNYDDDNDEIKFIPNKELDILLPAITNRDFKAFVQLSLMSGARPCEAIAVRYGKNLYKNKDGDWVIHLPKIKRVSYKKFPFRVDQYEDDLIPYFESLRLKENELVFKMTYATVYKLMKYYTTKNLSKIYSPKILRKTTRMIRSNAGYPHDWINKLMGHSPNSKVQDRYTNYKGIKNDQSANDQLKTQQYPGLVQEHKKLKLEFQAMKEQMREFKEASELLKALKLNDSITV